MRRDPINVGADLQHYRWAMTVIDPDKFPASARSVAEKIAELQTEWNEFSPREIRAAQRRQEKAQQQIAKILNRPKKASEPKTKEDCEDEMTRRLLMLLDDETRAAIPAGATVRAFAETRLTPGGETFNRNDPMPKFGSYPAHVRRAFVRNGRVRLEVVYAAPVAAGKPKHKYQRRKAREIEAAIPAT